MFQTKFDAANRSVESYVEIPNSDVILHVSTEHDKSRKLYMTSVYRMKVRNGIMSFRVVGDYLHSSTEPAARYSAKALKDLHERKAPLFLENEDFLRAAEEVIGLDI